MTTERQKLVVVAVDGSAAAEAAVDAAVELAEAMRAALLFVHASSPLAESLFREYPETLPPRDRVLSRDAVLAAAFRKAGDRSVEADVEVVADDGSSDALAAEIAGIADGRDATMIVTGSRGRGAVAGAVLGSVSHSLITQATVPVLVVHASTGRNGPSA